jgi:two-component system LytT family response regulator
MNSIAAIIVDDEQESRNTLRSFLQKYCPEVFLAAEAASVQEAVQKIREHRPQLVFLDISMPLENGFLLFDQFPDPPFYTVFVTAYDNYALEAIKRHALDYLLKPVSIDELIKAVATVRQRINDRTAVQRMQDMLYAIHDTNRRRIALPITEGQMYVNVADIVHCESEINYTRFHFADGKKMLVCQTLGTYEQLLKEYGFVRVHNRHLININFVEKYHRGRGGIVYLRNNVAIEVSQRKKEEFLKMMKQYNIS